MDNIDYGIIKKMLVDSRCSFRKIANELGVSTDTIIRRYNKLKKDRVFKPTIDIDIYKIGYEVRVWYMISFMPKTECSSVIAEVKKIEDIYRIIKAVGTYDLLVIAAVKDFGHMHKIKKLIAQIPGVKSIKGWPCLPSGNIFCSSSSASGFFNSDFL